MSLFQPGGLRVCAKMSHTLTGIRFEYPVTVNPVSLLCIINMLRFCLAYVAKCVSVCLSCFHFLYTSIENSKTQAIHFEKIQNG